MLKNPFSCVSQDPESGKCVVDFDRFHHLRPSPPVDDLDGAGEPLNHS